VAAFARFRTLVPSPGALRNICNMRCICEKLAIWKRKSTFHALYAKNEIYGGILYMDLLRLGRGRHPSVTCQAEVGRLR